MVVAGIPKTIDNDIEVSGTSDTFVLSEIHYSDSFAFDF